MGVGEHVAAEDVVDCAFMMGELAAPINGLALATDVFLNT
jgi:hypothetical protein